MQLPTLARKTRPDLFMLLAGHVVPAVLLAVVATLFVLDRRIPFDPDSLHGVVLDKAARGTEEIRIQWKLYRHRSCPTTIAREFVDSTGLIHRAETVYGPFASEIGWDTWISHVKVPAMAAWGPMRFRTTVQFHCGWTHQWLPLSIRTPEVVFEVLPPT